MAVKCSLKITRTKRASRTWNRSNLFILRSSILYKQSLSASSTTNFAILYFFLSNFGLPFQNQTFEIINLYLQTNGTLMLLEILIRMESKLRLSEKFGTMLKDLIIDSFIWIKIKKLFSTLVKFWLWNFSLKPNWFNYAHSWNFLLIVFYMSP